MPYAELLSVVSGLACVWLTVRQHEACWPVGIANNAFLSVICLQDQLYALLVLQQIYIALGLYGWWQWRFAGANPLQCRRPACLSDAQAEQAGGTPAPQEPFGDAHASAPLPLPVSRTPAWAWAAIALVVPLAWMGLAAGLVLAARYLKQEPPTLLAWDTGTAVACLVAQWLLTRKWIETWPIWIATNVSYLFLYAVQDRFLLALTQMAFIALSVQGWREWTRSRWETRNGRLLTEA